MNSTKTALILDLDGVLITTSPWKPDIIDADNYSKFNASCIAHLNILLDFGKFDIWLSSSRRERHSLEKFNEIFKYRKIKQPIIGFLPPNTNFDNRCTEISQWIKNEQVQDYLILDDDKSLHEFEHPKRLVLTKYMLGFNKEKLEEAKQKMKKR